MNRYKFMKVLLLIISLSACTTPKALTRSTITTFPPTATDTPEPTDTATPTNTLEPTPTLIPEYILLAERTNPNDIDSFPQEIQQALSNFEGNSPEIDKLVDQVLLESRRSYWEEIAQNNPEMVREVLRFMVVDHIYGKDIDIDALTPDQLQNEIRNMHEVPFFHFYIDGTRRLNQDSETLISVVLSHNEIRKLSGQPHTPYWEETYPPTRGMRYGFSEGSLPNNNTYDREVLGQIVHGIGIPSGDKQWGDFAGVSFLVDNNGEQHPIILFSVKETFQNFPMIYPFHIELDDNKPFAPSLCMTDRSESIRCPDDTSQMVTKMVQYPDSLLIQSNHKPIQTLESIKEYLTLKPSLLLMLFPSTEASLNNEYRTISLYFNEIGLEMVRLIEFVPNEFSSNYSDVTQ